MVSALQNSADLGLLPGTPSGPSAQMGVDLSDWCDGIEVGKVVHMKFDHNWL